MAERGTITTESSTATKTVRRSCNGEVEREIVEENRGLRLAPPRKCTGVEK
jgi:hypothetical protein